MNLHQSDSKIETKMILPMGRSGCFRACLHGDGGPQVGEVTCGGSPRLTCKRDHIKMRDYTDRRVTSPTLGPPPPCKQALTRSFIEIIMYNDHFSNQSILYDNIIIQPSCSLPLLIGFYFKVFALKILVYYVT